MIKNVFITAFIISLLGTFLKYFTTAIGKDNISKITETVVSILLIFVFLSVFSKNQNDIINYDYFVQENNYDRVADESLKGAIDASLEKIQSALCDEFFEEFGVRPRCCEIKIDNEKLKIEKLLFYCSKEDIMTSTYKIKEFFKDKYNIEPEIVFK